MQNNINEQSCIDKLATVIKCKEGIATVHVDTGSDDCKGCRSNKQSKCALYTFGAIFSRQRDTWQLPSEHPLVVGKQVRLLVQSSVLLKVAIGCYGLPVIVLLSSTMLSHLLVGIEWLSITVGFASLMLSYLVTKRWLSSIVTDIKLMP